MRFDDLVEAFGTHPIFDVSTLRTLFPEERSTVSVQVHRWKRAGKIVELRRGLYVLAEPYRRAPVHGPAVAEAIYPPSYLSLQWALSWYGVVPEKAGTYTSVSTRETRRFVNPFGVFTYRTIQPALFFGEEVHTVVGAEVRMALPEKALVDLWYLESGEWTVDRMASFRFDPAALHDGGRLHDMIQAVNRPRMYRALGAWRQYAAQQSDFEEITG